jgi:hypothetical protein
MNRMSANDANDQERPRDHGRVEIPQHSEFHPGF